MTRRSRVHGCWLHWIFGAGLVLGMGTVAGLAAPTAVKVSAATSCTNIATWSTTRRLSQLIMVSGQFSDVGASVPYARAGVGAFVMFGQPPTGSGPAIASGLAAIYNQARAAGQVLPWVSTDEEGGSVARLSNVIGALPGARQMAAQWTPAQVQSVMASHGAAMWNLGVIMDLAPVADTAAPSNPIADESERSFSENGQTAAAYAVSYATGLRSAGVLPVFKHFPGLGHASANTDLAPAIDPTLAQLESNDLIPFEQGIKAQMPVIMISHASVPGLTGTVPASLSSATYQFLRDTLHFGGVALTDSLSAAAISAYGYSQAAAAVRAIESGVDMVMIDAGQWQASMEALQSALNSGALSIGRVNGAAGRILLAKGFPVCPITMGPVGLAFGNWSRGTTSGPAIVTLTNTSPNSITIKGIAITGNFTESNSCGVLPATLAPGNNCAVTVRFAPRTRGVQTGSLTISENPGGPGVVRLTGYSVPFLPAATFGGGR